MKFVNGVERIADALELPKDILLNLSKVIVYGNRVVLVENFTSLCDYNSEYLILKLDKGQIKINGKNLVIKELSQKEINIYGEFFSIELMK
jgi:sporulation protein YqfC